MAKRVAALAVVVLALAAFRGDAAGAERATKRERSGGRLNEPPQAFRGDAAGAERATKRERSGGRLSEPPQAARAKDDPETVVVTLRPKPGAEAEVKKVIAAHWETARKLNLVEPEPHVTLQLKDETRQPYFVDIFTWRDRDIPDNAPAAILAIWNDMHRLTADRAGRPGLQIEEAKRVDR